MNRPGFRSRKPGRFLYAGPRARAVLPTLRFLAFHGKMRKQKAGSVVERRRKATLPAVLGTPEHCGLIRRDLVVCPPFWLLPRIETGDSFLWACCAPLLRPHPQGNVPAWALRGEPFGGYGGCPFRSP